MKALCRDCLQGFAAGSKAARCPACGSPRMIAHGEIEDLAIRRYIRDAVNAMPAD